MVSRNHDVTHERDWQEAKDNRKFSQDIAWRQKIEDKCYVMYQASIGIQKPILMDELKL